MIFLAFFVLSLAWAVLICVLLTRDGQSVGMKLMGICIVDTRTGKNGGFITNVVMRGLIGGILLNVIPFYVLVDPLFIFRKDRRCLHDLVAGTWVVNVSGKAQLEEAVAPGAASERKTRGVWAGVAFASLIVIGAGLAIFSSMGHLIHSATDGQSIGNLKGLRNRIGIYKKAHGTPPLAIDSLAPGHMSLILASSGHPRSGGVRYASTLDIKDSGQWLYVNDPKSKNFGTLIIDCTHQDEKGTPWSAY